MLIKKCGSSYAISLVKASCPKTREMKNILAMTLLVTGLAGNVFVYGQMPAPPTIQLKKASIDSIRILRPDHMPCLVTDLSKVEPMPVKKLDSRMVRPMPNGVPDGRPKVELAPKKKRE